MGIAQFTCKNYFPGKTNKSIIKILHISRVKHLENYERM